MEKIYGEKGIVLPKKLVIPEISDSRLIELYKTLKPIVEIDEMKYFLREFTLHELRRTSYIWSEREDKTEQVDLSRLESIDEFPCLHTCGYYGLFKPSIAEVLAQMPENLIGTANTFEIVESPETREDVFRYPEVVNNGFHLSKVKAYKYNK